MKDMTVTQVNGAPASKIVNFAEARKQQGQTWELHHPKGHVDNKTYLAWVLERNGLYPPRLANTLFGNAVALHAWANPQNIGIFSARALLCSSTSSMTWRGRQARRRIV